MSKVTTIYDRTVLREVQYDCEKCGDGESYFYSARESPRLVIQCACGGIMRPVWDHTHETRFQVTRPPKK